MVNPAWKLVVVSTMFLFTGNASATDNVVAGVADRMTQEALDAGAAGELELRDDLLDQALRVAPDHAPAHWARGELLQGGEWKSIGAIQEEARTNKYQQEYQTLKAQTTTPAAHLELAKWCDRNSLADEARYHWLSVLSADPQNKDALRALDCTWFNGQLVSRSMAADLKAERRERREAEKAWRARIAGWDRALASGGEAADRALADVAATVDESAIPEFERVAISTQKTAAAQARRSGRLCRAYVAGLERLPSYQASLALARVAVLADQEAVRVMAIEALKQRPTYEVLPVLFTGLTPVIQTRFDITQNQVGMLEYTHEMVVEGADADYAAEASKSYYAPAVVEADVRPEGFYEAQRRADARHQRAAQQMAREAIRLEQLAAAANADRQQLNSRIVAVLRKLTGKDYSDNPREWWDYWREENGYDGYRDTVTYRVVEKYDYPEYVYKPVPRPMSCFAAGTLVWTKAGMKEIQTVVVGDLVLTMDEQTGERAFRPVLLTTVRPPTPMMHLQASDHQIVCTLGHPFWVEGSGWRMAKELSVGDRITTATGSPLELRAVASANVDQEAFNLVVEGNNNYFVGQDGLLAHDNTQRRPELARAAQR